MQGGGEVLQAHKVMKQKNSSVHFATVAMRGGGTRPGGTAVPGRLSTCVNRQVRYH